MNVRRPGVSSVKVQKKRTSLTFPRAVPLEAWISIGVEIFSITDASSWWLGDWLIYGQNRYPDRYKRAIEASSLHYKTLRNYAWVARKFDVSRRRDTLSMQHHAEVAALTEEEQELWLDRAEQEGWSVTELRRNIKESKATGDRIQDVTAATVTLKAPLNECGAGNKPRAEPEPHSTSGFSEYSTGKRWSFFSMAISSVSVNGTCPSEP